MTTQSLSFRPSSFTISVVSNLFDSVDFHTKQLNDLCKLFYLLVVGAGSDGSGLLLYLGSVRHDWSPMKRNLYEMSQRATRILPLHGWGCNQRRRNRGKVNDRHHPQQRSLGKAGAEHGNQLCGPPEFFQLLSSKPKPMSPTTIPHKRPPSELAGCDAIPLAKIIEPAKITMDAASVFMALFYRTGGSVRRRVFRRRCAKSNPTAPMPISESDDGSGRTVVVPAMIPLPPSTVA